MKKTIILLKAVMLFVTAVWGVLFGIMGPVALYFNIADNRLAGLPVVSAVVPTMWMITAIAGFIVPCFLVMFKLYKTSAVICMCGTIALFVLHGIISNERYTSDDVFWLYMPLLLETIAVILIAVFANMGYIRIKMYEREKQKNAIAPSILGGTTDNNDNNKKRRK
ncbi:MAG: hypothetical protein FWD34_04635 [Oscillospiraceae bacterium]|nr:hypothetical protein [Oscillospiraceae bacterium]